MYLSQFSIIALLLAVVNSKVFLDERFEEPDVLFGAKSWIPTKEAVQSSFGEELRHGNWDVQSGELVAPESGVFYALHKLLPETISTETKDIVVQFTARMPEQPTCGGNYVKLLPQMFGEGPFTTESTYVIMFGPEQCSGQQELNIIIQHNGNDYFCKRRIPMTSDRLNHLYTLVLKSDGTYEVLIDEVSIVSGQVLDDWEFGEPKQIPDPNAVKPEDWDDRPAIANPEFIGVPEYIPDPQAKKPEDWDEEEKGEWKVPEIINPILMAIPPMIENPNFKGLWNAPLIDNPKYDPNARHIFENVGAIGLDLWHLKGGSTFDNLLVTDSIEFAKKVAAEEWADDFKVELAEYLANAMKAAEEKAEAEKAKAEKEAQEAAEKKAAEKNTAENHQGEEEKSNLNAQKEDATADFQSFLDNLMKRLESGDYGKMFENLKQFAEGAGSENPTEEKPQDHSKADL